MTVAVCEPVAAMSSCLDSLRETLDGLDGKGIVQTLRDIESLSRRAHAVMLDLVAEADSRGIAVEHGFRNTQQLLTGMLQLSAAEARTRVDHAAMVGARRAITGATLAPRLPATAAALASGEIGSGQLRVITETMTVLPASVPQPARDRAETDLAGYARDFDPRRLRIIAHRLVATLDPDGPAPGDNPTPAAPVRGELWLRDRRDGRLGLEGWLAAEHGSMVRALIEQLAARPTGGAPETRAIEERHADDFPTTAGEPPHLTVTIDWDALRTGLGDAVLDYGQLISAGDARRLACDCKLIPVVLGGDSEPLDVGRAMRTVPLGIRRALVARDGGCSFPGCDRPPGLCAAHHVRHWIDLGDTKVGNCCLLCPAHHHQVHLQGWDITIHGGRVEFRPPTIIDRRPPTADQPTAALKRRRRRFAVASSTN